MWEKKKIDDITLDLNMSKCVVEQILQLWCTSGEVVVQGHGKMGNRRKIMTPEEMEFLLWLTEQFPDLYLDEIQSIMQRLYGITVVISTLWDTMTNLGLTCKKLSKVTAEHNENLRSLFGFKIGHESPEFSEVFPPVSQAAVGAHGSLEAAEPTTWTKRLHICFAPDGEGKKALRVRGMVEVMAKYGPQPSNPLASHRGESREAGGEVGASDEASVGEVE
ncbi:hypothetical protein JB92DRAFT_3128798 [Gautieria morchelliformis]|nr:hypothetical protein JB92DRAFT_3128798 [Gautieria morchelliformis]